MDGAERHVRVVNGDKELHYYSRHQIGLVAFMSLHSAFSAPSADNTAWSSLVLSGLRVDVLKPFRVYEGHSYKLLVNLFLKNFFFPQLGVNVYPFKREQGCDCHLRLIL